MRSRKLFFFIVTFLVLTLSFVMPSHAATNLEVHFIDVGQADSIYFKLPNGENMLIDGGNNADGSLVVNYLTNQGVTTVDYVVGTHPHEDHIGGLDNVINNFNIGNVYLPSKTSTTITYNDLIQAIQNKNLAITTAKNGVTLFDTTVNSLPLKAVILSPSSSSYSDTNDYSVVIRLTYGSTSYMLTGDAETPIENELLASGNDLTADVLKVGHHGSHSSTSQAFLDAVQPKLSVISASIDNSYGHPHQEVVDRLMTNEIDIFRTDQQGTIITISDGSVITTNMAPWFDGARDGSVVDPIDPTPDPAPTNETILINEVLPAPQSAYSNEWVELYNPTANPVDISGYVIDDVANGGASPYTIPEGTTIEAHGFYTYSPSGYVFNNSGDDVLLIKPDGSLSDSYTYGSSSYDQSWYRETDGGTWSVNQTDQPTQSTSNQGQTVEPLTSVLINEVLAAPQSTYSSEWIELYNETSVEIDLSGYIIDDIVNGGSSAYTIPQGTIIPANGYYVYYPSGSVFNNSGDDVILMKPDGTVVDSYTYGSASYDSSWYRETDGGSWATSEDLTPTPNLSNETVDDTTTDTSTDTKVKGNGKGKK